MVGKILFLALTVIFGCHCQLEEVIEADNKFTSDVYEELSKSQKENIVYSGLSTDLVLSLLTSGANGDTKEELIFALNLVKDDDTRNNGFKQLTSGLNVNTENLKLLSANKIYPAEEFTVSEAFENTTVNDYNAEVENLNYHDPNQAADTINNWVEENTNKKIQNLIDPSLLDPETKLVLVNTLYFSGKWVHPFEFTREGLFYPLLADPIQAYLLGGVISAKYRHCEYYQTKFVELDFEGGDVSMTFILPDDNDNGLTILENDLVGVTEEHADDMKEGTVAITIPKFRIENELNLVPVLKKLGAQKIFTASADLSGISSTSNLYVDAVIQKTYIDVDIGGVEAAAPTGIVSGSIPAFTFKADRPFLYYIREKNTGALLFVGRYQR